MPCFNEKSLLRLADGLAETGAIAPDGFRRAVQAIGRFRAIAEAMGVARSTPWRPRPFAGQPMGRSSPRRSRRSAVSRFEMRQRRRRSAVRNPRRDIRPFRPVGTVGDMGGGSLEVAEAIDDHVGKRWVSLPLGALPVEAMMWAGLSAAKREIDEILQRSLPRELAGSVFYPVGGGWRTLAKAHMEAVGAPVKVVHGYTIGAVEAREFARRNLTALGGEAGCDAWGDGTAGADIALCGVGAGPRAETSGPRAGRLFRSRLARGISLFSAQPRRTISRPAGRGRAAYRSAAGAGARFRAGTGVVDRQARDRRNRIGDAAPRRDLRALRHCVAGRARPPGRREFPPAAAVSVHWRHSSRESVHGRHHSSPATPVGPMRLGSTRRSACSRRPSAAERKF